MAFLRLQSALRGLVMYKNKLVSFYNAMVCFCLWMSECYCLLTHEKLRSSQIYGLKPNFQNSIFLDFPIFSKPCFFRTINLCIDREMKGKAFKVVTPQYSH